MAVVALAIGACGEDDAGSQADASVPGDGRNPQAGWVPLPATPVAIQEIGVAALGGKIYTVGGFIGSTVTANVYAYDIASGAWAEVMALPIAAHHVNLAVAGGKLYVVGALATFSFTPVNDVYEYDPAQDMWTQKASLPTGFERGASAVGVIDGVIYVAGGSGAAQSVDQFTSYDPELDTHDTTLPTLPAALNHLVGGGVGGKFYAIGGRDIGITGIKNTTYEYDPAQNTWTDKSAMPTARGGTAAGIVDEKIIVVGGEGNAAVSSGVFPQTEMYDPATDTWTSLSDMRTPRHGMGAAGDGGVLYVPAGADVQAFGAVDTFEAFTP